MDEFHATDTGLGVAMVDFHAVKVAAFADAAKRFGVASAQGLAALGAKVRPAFQSHALPTYHREEVVGGSGLLARLAHKVHPSLASLTAPSLQTVEHAGYGPGMLDAARDAWKTDKGSLPARALEGLGNSVKTLGHGVADLVRGQTLGNPVDLAAQLAQHRADTGSWGGAVGRQLHHHYLHPQGRDPLSLAFSLGLPAKQLYDATQDPEHRGENVGGAVAGLATSPFTAHLGIPGGLVQAPLVGLGRALGRRFD